MAISRMVYECFVECKTIVDVMWLSDDPDFHRPPEDLYCVQTKGIPGNFGKKDKYTRQQAIFSCRVCHCHLKSISMLRIHCKGTLHIPAALQRKKELHIEEARQKLLRIQRATSLKDLLDNDDLGDRVVGLNYIEEYVCDDREPLYICVLCSCEFIGPLKYLCDHLGMLSHQQNYMFAKCGQRFIYEEAAATPAHKRYSLVHRVHSEADYGLVCKGIRPPSSLERASLNRGIKRSRYDFEHEDLLMFLPQSLRKIEPPTVDMTIVDLVKEEEKPKAEDSVLAFHFAMSNYVRKCLNSYYAYKADRKIVDKGDYVILARGFSHMFRSEEKQHHVCQGKHLDTIVMTDEMKERIKARIDAYFETRPSLPLP